MFKKNILLLLTSIVFSLNVGATMIEKALIYDQHTLSDWYIYKISIRHFQWSKIRTYLTLINQNQSPDIQWAVIKNYKNINDMPPMVKSYYTNEYDNISDQQNTERNQSAPLYSIDDTSRPERYARDGLLVKVLAEQDDFFKVKIVNFPDNWLIPKNYLSLIDKGTVFSKVIFVDRSNQNISSLEKVDNKWLVRSMNPATTGLHDPPFRYRTPLGIYVIQAKKKAMNYNIDGSDEPGGFAPYGSRFSAGVYIHGIPVNLPATEIVEISPTLGTTPHSHKCVRNATSHAEFLYDWAPVNQALVIIFD